MMTMNVIPLESIPFNQNFISDVIAQNGRGSKGYVTDYVISRSANGSNKLEIKVYYPDVNGVKFFELIDGFNGRHSNTFTMLLKNNATREQRDSEIKKFYNLGLTQEFIGKIFGLSQPSISNIIRKGGSSPGQKISVKELNEFFHINSVDSNNSSDKAKPEMIKPFYFDKNQ